MIIGKVQIGEDAVHTHSDSYLIHNLEAVSVRRPFFGSAIALSVALSGFGIAFVDLLHVHELGTIVVIAIGAGIMWHQLGQLKLISRDLKNTELSNVIWGQHAKLQSVRHQIITAMRDAKRGKAAGSSS